MKTFRHGGIHPPQNKLTAEMAIRDTDLPRRVTLSMAQHIGKPAVAAVKRGDHVMRGDVVGRAAAFVSANIHTPISGTVKSIDNQPGYNGRPTTCVIIEADDSDHYSDLQTIADARPNRTERQALDLSPKEIIDIIAETGIVGLGGAAFPTHVKLTIPEGKSADTLLINGAECEPYLTCDNRIMIENGAEIALGAELLRHAINATRGVIAIENNKPEAVKRMQQAVHPYPALSVVALKTKYPQGGEKQLIAAVTGREVPDGGLPIDAGTVVDNVATALAVYHAIIWGIPLIERTVTIATDEQGLGNLRIPIGSNIGELLQKLGGIPDNVNKIIMGGPMMGQAASTVNAPSTKALSGILLLSRDTSRREPQPCIRCGRCVDACPMNLEPYLIATCSAKGFTDRALEHGLMSCIECGSCSYICPAWRPLTDNIRLGKSNARRAKHQ